MTPVRDYIPGHTYHGRKGKIANAFRYAVDYVLIDPEASGHLPWLFSRNRHNLASVWDRDHGGPRNKGTGTAWVRDVLRQHGLEIHCDKILLLAQAKVLGYVFNPVSFWLCYDKDKALRIVIAEVNNTFGDRHSYLCHTDDLVPLTAQIEVKAQKIFHVSPFQKIAGEYTFRYDITQTHIGIWIDYTAGENGLIATLTGPRKPLTSLDLLKAASRRPFGARRIMALIHWQALKLWWKGARFTPRPLPPDREVSR